jgi:predicted ATP-dependent serine protease
MQRQPEKNLREYAGEDKVISAQEMLLNFNETPESLLRVKTNIPSLDAAVDGVRNGELIAVSGPTKMGKTLLCQTLTANFARQQYSSLWFTFEVPVRQFLTQFPDLPLIYLPSKLKAHAMTWLEERIIESFQKYHTRIVFCDHLHYLVDLARTKNPSIEIGAVIRRLKTMAVSGGFAIFLLCHTIKGKSEDNLSYESIRDSSFISQESDSVWMIKRTPTDKKANLSKLCVEFHRRTGVLERMIELEKVNGYLREPAKQEDYERARS